MNVGRLRQYLTAFSCMSYIGNTLVKYLCKNIVERTKSVNFSKRILFTEVQFVYDLLTFANHGWTERRFLYYCGFGSLVMGLLNTWPSYTAELFYSNTTTLLSAPMTEGDEALLGSLPSLGAMLGSGVTGICIDYLGRRNGGVVLTLPVLISWAIVGVTSSINLMLAARFLAGISGGGAMIIALIFISEVTEDSIRGLLASIPLFLYCVGIAISYIIGGLLTYQTIIWFNLISSLAATILAVVVTESPVYFLKHRREEDAKQSVAKYRGVPVSSKTVSDEISKLKQLMTPSVKLVSIKETDPKAEEAEKEKLNLEEFNAEKPQSTSTIKLLFSEPASKRAFIVVTTVTTVQVFMGMVPVQVYANTVFKQTDPSKVDLYTILFSVITFLGCGVSAVITDKAGRRILLISSSVLIFVCMMALGYLLQTKSGPPLLNVIIIFAYCFFFLFGAGSIPYVLLTEVFIPEVQNLASILIVEWVWFLNFAIIAVFPYMNNFFGIYGTFYIFGVMGLINAIIAYFIVPETKGLSISQIQDMFLSRKNN